MCLRMVNPTGCDNGDAIAEHAGKCERLDVKTPAVNTRHTKNLLCRIGRKCFETALCVPDTGNGNKLYEKVARIAQEASPPKVLDASANDRTGRKTSAKLRMPPENSHTKARAVRDVGHGGHDRNTQASGSNAHKTTSPNQRFVL